MSDGGTTSTPSARLWRDRVRRATARLAGGIDGWLASWTGATAQHSQIQRTGAALRALCDRLAQRAGALDGEALAAARALDGDVAVVERLWRYLAERFDQRRADAEQARVLAAADAVVWACAAEARTLAPAAPRPLPLPLPYLEPAFTPTAIPRTRPPLALPAADRSLARMLAFLPVPLIGLPTGVAAEPWWLVLVAHEVGHHVQYDLEPDQAVVARTADAVTAAADDARWGDWGHELFADGFAVAAVGAAAVAATIDLEWTDAPAMAAPRGAYPPALVRIAVQAEVARALGLAVDAPEVAALAAVTDDREVAAWIARAPAVARALVAMRLGDGDLRALATRFPATGDARLGDVLAGDDVALTGARFRPARAAAAAFAAYRGLAAIADDTARTAAQVTLRDRALGLVAAVTEPGDVWRGGPATRAAGDDDVAAGLDQLLPSRAP